MQCAHTYTRKFGKFFNLHFQFYHLTRRAYTITERESQYPFEKIWIGVRQIQVVTDNNILSQFLEDNKGEGIPSCVCATMAKRAMKE
jgi:hypothetical protein